MSVSLSNLDPAQLKADAENIVNDVEQVVAFAEKFKSLLPATVVTGLDDLQTFLVLVQKFLAV